MKYRRCKQEKGSGVCEMAWLNTLILTFPKDFCLEGVPIFRGVAPTRFFFGVEAFCGDMGLLVLAVLRLERKLFVDIRSSKARFLRMAVDREQ